MIVRLIEHSDADQLVEMGRHFAAEARPHVPFSEQAVRRHVDRSVQHADPTTFVAERQGRLLGFLVCNLDRYVYSDAIFAVETLIYVRPEYRGGPAAKRLVEQYACWAKDIGALEAYAGVDAVKDTARVGRLFEKSGFRLEGASYRRVIQ